MTCPECGSNNVRYLEDVTNKHRIVGEKPEIKLLIIEADPEDTAEETSNEGLECEDCLGQWNLDDDIAIEFKGSDQGRRDSGKEPQGSVPEASTQKAPANIRRQKLLIHVSPEFPPIPDRSNDYAAWIDGEEESTTVCGPTPGMALAVLVERLVDREMKSSDAHTTEEGGSRT
ncbi:MAG TPA: hypothetical protein VLH09_14745 [Bryobacteraceae bacterium]|nr:hypothetical protein [Bryobacteraceae bacterium]